MGKGTPVLCEKCGKRLIDRLPNGLWHFRFGKSDGGDAPVEMKIHGSLQIVCLRKSCRHLNTLTFLPPAFQVAQPHCADDSVGNPSGSETPTLKEG